MLLSGLGFSNIKPRIIILTDIVSRSRPGVIQLLKRLIKSLITVDGYLGIAKLRSDLLNIIYQCIVYQIGIDITVCKVYLKKMAEHIGLIWNNMLVRFKTK